MGKCPHFYCSAQSLILALVFQLVLAVVFVYVSALFAFQVVLILVFQASRLGIIC